MGGKRGTGGMESAAAPAAPASAKSRSKAGRTTSDDATLQAGFLAWYRQAARDLPWRRTRDPYAVWVSEIMLQQTRVDVATPYYLRWMERFPTVQALAAADPEEVLQAWAGLGYYSRARNLHAAARLVAANGGSLPKSAEQLRDLPGIGEYTSGAIASIAFGERVPAVDGNVVRVLARLHGWTGRASSPTLQAKVGKAAARLVPGPGDEAGDWNQALMDLGATVCTPRNPRCDACPVAAACIARAKGTQHLIPGPKNAAPVPVERRAFAVVRQGGRILLVRNPARGLLAGLWSLPGGPADRPLADLVLEQSGVAVRLAPSAPRAARHQFSHRTWEMEVHLADPVGDAGPSPGPEAANEMAWVDLRDLPRQALPSAMRTVLAVAGLGGGTEGGHGMADASAPPARGRKPKRRQGSGPA